MKLHISIIAAVLVLILLFSAPLAVLSEAQAPVDTAGAKAALLINVETGKTVFAKNADTPLEVAGLKRLPALLAVCTAFSTGMLTDDTDVLVSKEAADVKGATAFISPNEHIKAGELLKAAVILNAGDAICALLRSIYPSETASLEYVNGLLEAEGARKIENSMGEGCLFTLEDIARIGIALSRCETYLKYSSVYIDELRHENASPTELVNPNRLVRHYSGCFGLATGSVGSSEYSGAFIARRGTTTFLSITAGAPDSTARFRIGSELLDHGFAAYRITSFEKLAQGDYIIPVDSGTESELTVAVSEGYALIPLSDTRVTAFPEFPERLEAPVSEGAVVGRVVFKNASGEIIAEAPLTARSGIDRLSFSTGFIGIIKNWLHIKTEP